MTDTWNPFLQQPQGLRGYDLYDPNELATMRMQRGVRSPSRFQQPMPQGMTTPEVGSAVKNALFGNPDATVPMQMDEQGKPVINQAGYPPSEWSPAARDTMFDAAANAATMQAAGPLANATAMAVKPAVEAAKSAPKTVGALMGLTASTEAADTSKDTGEHAGKYQPEIDKLTGNIDANEKKLQELSEKQLPPPRGRGKQFEAAQKNWEANNTRLQGQIDSLKGSVDKDRSRRTDLTNTQATLNKEAAAKAQRELPMTDRQPWMAALPAAGGVLAAASAYDPRVRAVGQFNQYVGRMADTAGKVEKAAVKAGTKMKLTPADSLNASQLDQYVKGFDAAKKEIKPGVLGKLGAIGTAGLGGGTLAGELSMLPSQIDWATQGKDTPAYKAAFDRLTTGPGWAKTGTSALAGLTGGSVGTTVPTSWAGKAGVPAFADMPRAQGALDALLKRLQGPSAAASPLPAQLSPLVPPGLVPFASRRRNQSP